MKKTCFRQKAGRLSIAAVLLLFLASKGFAQESFVASAKPPQLQGRMGTGRQDMQKMSVTSWLQKVKKAMGINFIYNADLVKDKWMAATGISTDLDGLRLQLKQLNLKMVETAPRQYVLQADPLRPEKNDSREKTETTPYELLKGSVTDEKGVPVQGASVVVKGTTRGTSTNVSGHFLIEAEKGEVLLISYIGYADQQIAVKDFADLHIVLQPLEKAVEEVVVTALGIKKEKRSVSFAAQEVKGKDLEKAREANVVSNLTGKVAGLSIRNKSTLFENPEINLRGGPTLVVIDGVPTKTDFWNLNSDDIENVNVLKGTAASALYGSLGINGAIMITTKKGKGGANGVEVSFNSSTQFQAGFLRIPETQTEYGMGWNGQYAFKDGRGGGLYDD
ncbi:MAG TPA: carboxypeptidase-like regulatory domain-containing protein, partial [Flavisolibacter sp.]|nr:carboxypeptidase-like regulatory domain-containing protein [Flavisolibacter sp.]